MRVKTSRAYRQREKVQKNAIMHKKDLEKEQDRQIKYLKLQAENLGKILEDQQSREAKFIQREK